MMPLSPSLPLLPILQATAPQVVGDAAAWVGADDYPADALRAGAQGAVTVALTIDPAGRVAGCLVSASSGNASLDAATCRLIGRRANFSPARDRRGRAVAGTVTKRIRWIIPPDAPEPIAEQVMRTHVTLAQGKVAGCASTEDGKPRTPAQSADDCANFGDPLVLRAILGDAYDRANAIDVTMGMRPGDVALPPIPAGARRVVMSEALFTIGADRRISGCTNRALRVVGGHSFDLCAMRDASSVFAGTETAFVVSFDVTAFGADR